MHLATRVTRWARPLANPVGLVLIAVLGLTSLAAADRSTVTVSSTCAVLGPGASGAAVSTVQRAIGADADGDFGSMTAKALTAWQRKHKVARTGVVDAATWQALPKPAATAACGQRVGGTGAAVTCTVLHYGASGTAVAVLQTRLRIPSDGGFGPQTRGAVLAAQRRLKLAPTGVVDAATWGALGLTGTPACMAAEVVKTAVVTPSPTPSSTSSATATPAPPSDAAQQAKVQAQVVALAAGLAATPGTTTNPLSLAALHFAQAQTGKPYKWAGVGPASYDCSGLTMAAWRAAGVTTPRVAADQYGFGVPVPLDQVQQGDLLFYAMDLTKPATIYHVVMYAGHGTIVDAPYTGAFVGTRTLWTRNLLPVAWRPGGQVQLPAKAGDTGWTVAQLQQSLDRHGATLTVDGGYGPMTAAAVRSWQAAHKLPATGAADLATWLSLAGP